MESETGSSLFDIVYSFLNPFSEISNDFKCNHENTKTTVTAEESSHHFVQIAFTMPTFCDYCKEFIWGFTQRGFSCSVCGCLIHSHCIGKVPSNCRPESTKDLTLPSNGNCNNGPNVSIKNTALDKNDGKLYIDYHRVLQNDERQQQQNYHYQQGKIIFRHCLVEERISLGSECSICRNSFELFLPNGFRCTRCDKVVHNDCSQIMKERPCKPRHRSLLYVPEMNFQDKSIDQDQENDNVICSPLLIFVNSRSGGKYGHRLTGEFSQLLDGSQVFDLNKDGGPEIGLQAFHHVRNLRILVCGGDGTVSWVLSAIDQFAMESFPPVAILPLGTGNDLSRTLGWGTGYSGEELSPFLDSIQESMTVKLDRWKVLFSPGGKVGVMNNYMSVGVDAEVALEFHKLRNAHPELFSSQFINRIWYTHYGFKCMFSDINDLREMVSLEVNGEKVMIPEGLAGIMFLNLPSYSGGVNLWGTEIPDDYKPQAIDDKIFEVVGITGSFHMGTVFVSLSEAIKIAQGNSMKITLKSSLPVQVDGEPWLQEPCEIQVSFWNQARMLYKTNDFCSFRASIKDEADSVQQYKLRERALLKENDRLKKELEALKSKLNKERIKRIALKKDLKSQKTPKRNQS